MPKRTPLRVLHVDTCTCGRCLAMREEIAGRDPVLTENGARRPSWWRPRPGTRTALAIKFGSGLILVLAVTAGGLLFARAQRIAMAEGAAAGAAAGALAGGGQ